MQCRLLPVAVLACCAAHVGAQEQPRPDPPIEEPLARLIALLNAPVEIASKRLQNAIESPQAIEVLTADQIQASGVFRLVDVLKLLTSVQIFELGKDSVQVSIRGTSVHAQRRNVQLLVDGVPLFNTESGPVSFDLLPIPIDAIEKVEVVRGPSSSLFGANAQVGVIAITTKKAREGTALSLRAGRAGSDTSNTQGFYSYGSSGFKLAMGFGGSSQGDSGHSERVLGGTRRVDPQDQNHGSQVFLRPEVMLGKGRIWALYAKAINQVGPQVVETSAGIQIYQFAFIRSSTEAAQVGWSQAWSPQFHTELKVNRNRLIPVSGAPMEVVPGSPTSAATVPVLQALDPAWKSDYDILDSTTEQVILQGNWDPADTLHVVFGADTARLKAAKALTVGFLEERRDSTTGAFVSVDWTLGSFAFSTGARFENGTLGGSRISPRAALVYTLTEDSVFRAGYYTSTRSPQVSELTQDIRIPGRPAPLGNPEVKPEAFDNVEFGYRKNFIRWSLDVTAYQMTLRKVIDPQPTGLIVGGFPQTQFQNSRTSLTNRGLELSLKGELAAGWLLGFNAAGVDFKDEAGVHQAYSPAFKANLWTRYHHQNVQAYVALQHTGAYTMTNQANIAGPKEDTPSRLQAHINLGYQLGSGILVSIYGINLARASEESTAGSINNSHLIRFSRREFGLQASYRF